MFGPRKKWCKRLLIIKIRHSNWQKRLDGNLARDRGWVKARGKEREILFRLHVQAHAYLKPGLGTSCCVVLRRASRNNGFVHWTSLRSLICFVIRGELQPTRLRLGSRSLPLLLLVFLPAHKDMEQAVWCCNKGFSCWSPPVWSFPLQVRVCGGRQDSKDKEQTAG